MNGNNKLANIHNLHQGYVSDKWEIYLSVYDRIFTEYKQKEIILLELGIQNGGSLEIWSKYFLNNKIILGCDIDQKCADLEYENSNIKVIVGDATSKNTKKQILEHTTEFDIIIEDASHISNHIIKAFCDFFPYIKEEGVFIAEDLHCSYWEKWEGGIYHPYSSISFFKLLSDIINYEHWGIDLEKKSILNGYCKQYDLDIDEDVLSYIHSIEFVNSMCIIKKKNPSKNILGKRNISGKIALVSNDPLFVQSSNSIPSNEHENIYSTLLHDPRETHFINLQKMQEKEQEVYDKEIEIQNLNDKMQEKEQEVYDKEVHIQNLNREIHSLHDIIQSIRIKNRIKRIIKKFIPKKIWKILRYVKNNQSCFKLAYKVLKKEGLSSLLGKIDNITLLRETNFVNIHSYVEELLTDDIRKEINDFKEKPLISIIMPVYNVESKWLDLAIKSIENQWYTNWEICIVDDKSTNEDTIKYLKSINRNKNKKVKFLNKNLNISGASNEALKLASGEYIVLMDNDDEITTNALYEIVKGINKTGAEFIYSDENKIEMNGNFCEPHFKPNYAPDMILSQNYISHLAVIKKNLIDKVNGFSLGLEGSQDHDLYLKVLECTDKIEHIPKILYHWRKIPGSTASEFGEKSYAQKSGVNAIEQAMKRRNIDAIVEDGKHPGTYRVKYKILNSPLVSIIIPFKDMPELLKMCIESILEKSTYKNFEIIGISNNSTDEETFSEMKRLENMDSRIKFYEYNVPFNYSDINNYAVNNYAKGEHILLLNNDIEIITEDWIESMLGHSQQEGTGCVGAKLYYPNDAIQHGGVIIGLGGVAGHSHKHFDKRISGYFHRLNIIQNLSAVTAACLMVKKSIFRELEGLNEEDLKIAFNDIDFCLRVQELGYKNVYTPYCEAYHHESISRGAEDNPEKIARFNAEVNYMKTRHSDILKEGDPFYNINLTLDREDFTLC